MNITIGENIKNKRLELQKTQEQLAEAVGVSCAAVSKWERGEAYPDITMLFPIARFFRCSIDELMGYNKDLIEAEIQDIINTYTELYRKDFNKAAEFIRDAYKRYPDDYRIIHYYMWNVAGDYADNDNENLLRNIDEPFFYSLEAGFYSRLANDIKYRFGGGSREDIDYTASKYFEALSAINEFENGSGALCDLYSVHTQIH